MLQHSLTAFSASLSASLNSLNDRFSAGAESWRSLSEQLVGLQKKWSVSVDEQRAQEQSLIERLTALTNRCNELQDKLTSLEVEWAKLAEQEHQSWRSIELRLDKLESQ